MAIRVLIVDDDEPVRRTLCRAFGRSSDFEVVGEAADGESAVETAASTAPDVIVMDVQMPRLSGFDAARQLRGQGVGTPVLFLTADTTAEGRMPGLGGVRLVLKGSTSIADTMQAVRDLARPTGRLNDDG